MAGFKKIDLFFGFGDRIFLRANACFVLEFKRGKQVFEILMPYANYLFLIFPLVCGGGIVITHFVTKIAYRFLYQFGKFFLVGGV